MLIKNKVLIDVTHTARVPITTGIQRVVRECVRRWVNLPDAVFVTWIGEEPNGKYHSLRALTEAEVERLIRGHIALIQNEDDAETLTPINCRYFVPEVAMDHWRPALIKGLTKNNAVGAIGHDLIPLTTGETTVNADAINDFAAWLNTMEQAKLIVTTSHQGSEMEFKGWKKTLLTKSLNGPEILTAPLPALSHEVDSATFSKMRMLLTEPGLPMVLVVGSQEPRKNHLAVLYAAEVLWRERMAFSLVFIGGNSWNSQSFGQAASSLSKKYPLTIIRKADDQLLWSAYRLAEFTVFPSLNEGFGLPVAESLAVGTPVITSNFGSMAEIAAGRGSLLIDPRDDDSLIAAMRSLLTDKALLTELRAQAESRRWRTWDQYAGEVWEQIKTMPVG